MSINDLLNVNLESLSIVFVVIVIVAIIGARAMRKKIDSEVYGDGEHIETREDKNAKIIAKRTAPYQFNKAVIINTVVFELSNGSRLELAIKNPDTYSVMFEGDCGTLGYQGKKFVSFERR